jgi:Zn-dependent protease
MFVTRWRLFRVQGIPLNIDAGWLIILALVSWTLSNFLREIVPGLNGSRYWILGLITALTFFVCIVLHELGHALMARRLGIPIRGITLFLFGGVAELEKEPKSAAGEFIMAIAGPVVSAVLAGLFWLAGAFGAEADWQPIVLAMLSYLSVINLFLLVFNLVPAFPLDGGRVFRSFLWGAIGNFRRATHWAAMVGQAFAWFLMGLGLLNLFAGHFFGGIWLGLIGLYLNRAAQASYQQVVAREVLQGEPIAQFMNPNPVVVPPAVDLYHWVEDYVFRFHDKTYPVASNGKLEGVIATRDLSQFPRSEWDLHTVGEAMERDLEPISIRPNADGLQALEQMKRCGSSRLMVTENGTLKGMVSLKDLLKFLQLKLELAGEPE